MRWLLCASVLMALTGCHAFYIDIDGRIERRASEPIDPQATTEPVPRPVFDSGAPVARFGAVTPQREIQRTSAHHPSPQPDKDKKPKETMLDKLKVPPGVPGYDAPEIQPPPAKATEAEKKAWLDKQFPPLLAVPPLRQAKLGSDGQPLTLSDLQQIALRLNPTIRQAHQDIQSMRGLALQAGLYPNPVIGYEGSSIGEGNDSGVRSPGQQGVSIGQSIVTAGKLTLARAAALRDVEISEHKMKQTETDVQAQVRRGYFAVLAAQKNFETTLALSQLIDALYNVLLQQFQGGEVAAYEPMQIRVLALQARGNLVVAHNRYESAWKQLAATLGIPNEPLTALAGKLDMAVPHFEYEAVLNYVLANHSEVQAARAGVDKARFLARLAEVQPYPDLNVHVAFQKDYASPPFGTVASVSVGAPFPLWNRNQGNIQSARALLGKALDENQRVQNELTSKVAEAFERYANNRTLLEMYKKQILPNQVQAFRASVASHVAVGGKKEVSYNDLVNSQQTLSALISNYLGALNEQWIAVVDIGQLLQTRDLFQNQSLDEVAPIPDVYDLMRERHFHR